MSISNDYMVSYRCEQKIRLFNLLHRTAPFIKIIAFATIFVGIIFPYLFIATALLWALSVVMNYFKWYLVYTYSYVINQKNLTVTKSFSYIKPKILADVELKNILKIELIKENHLEDFQDINQFFCKQKHFDNYVLIQTINVTFIIVVNNYFYALLKRRIDDIS